MTEEVELTLAAWEAMEKRNATLVDLRDAAARAYGMLPGAVALSPAETDEMAEQWRDGCTVVLYCARGQISMDKAEELRGQGVRAFSLAEGYAGYLRAEMQRQDILQRREKIEEGLRKTYHERLFSKFARAVKT